MCILYPIPHPGIDIPVETCYHHQTMKIWHIVVNTGVIAAILATSFSFATTVEAEPYILNAVVTAYSSTPEETDDDPFITASGSYVYDGTIACPMFIPLGTLVILDGRVYTCEDRMGLRIRKHDGEDSLYHFDIWKETKHDALKYGRQTHSVIVAWK